jgi:hypothetical protein
MCANGAAQHACFDHEETLANQSIPVSPLQCYSLNHGKLESVMESEKQHGFKCCTFGASSLVDRHLATGDYEVCLRATPPNLADFFFSPLSSNPPLQSLPQKHPRDRIYSHSGIGSSEAP